MSNKRERSDNTVQTTGFNALTNTDFSATVSDELEGLDITFERVKIPAGGTIMFELPDEDGETTMIKEFTAVILYHHPLNSYYETKYTGGSNPPDCGSFDGKKGSSGRSCATCAYNQFGSGENGAKSCRNKRRVYILREGEQFPLLLTLPTGSLNAFTKYLKTQLSKGRASNSIVTRFSLKKATNAGGIAYSQAYFAADRILSEEEYAYIKPLTDEMKAYASQIGFDNTGAALIVDEETGEVIKPLGGNNSHV